MSEMMSQLIFATKKLLIIALIVIAGSVAGHAQENLPEETGAPGSGKKQFSSKTHIFRWKQLILSPESDSSCPSHQYSI